MRKTWRDCFSVSSPFTHPRTVEQMCASCRTHFSVQWGLALIALEGNETKISFPFLRIHPFLLIVLVCVRTKQVLHSCEIRRIGSSVINRHDWRFTCESDECCPDRQQKQARKTSLLRFVSLLNWYGSKQELLNSYQHGKLTVFLKQRLSQIILHKARLFFQPCFQ